MRLGIVNKITLNIVLHQVAMNSGRHLVSFLFEEPIENTSRVCFVRGYYNTYYAFQVLCTIGKLKEIPDDFPLETEEITISNQDIRTISANGKAHSYSN